MNINTKNIDVVYQVLRNLFSRSWKISWYWCYKFTKYWTMELIGRSRWYILRYFKMLFTLVKFLDTRVSQTWVWSEQEDWWEKQISIGCCQQRIYISRGAIINGKKFHSFRGGCLEVSISLKIIIIITPPSCKRSFGGI